MNTKIIDDVKYRATTMNGAYAIAALVGIASFVISRRYLNRKTITAAMDASALATSTFGVLRKVANEKPALNA